MGTVIPDTVSYGGIINPRFARIAATVLATGALLLAGGIGATAAQAATANPQITDAVTATAATSSGHDWNDVPDPTMRDLHQNTTAVSGLGGRAPGAATCETFQSDNLGARSVVDIITC